MKRIATLLLALTLCLGLFACAEKNPGGENPLAYDYDLSEYITLPEYMGVTVNKSDVTPSAQDLEERKKTDFAGKDITGTVKDGDTVVIDYVGKRDGVAFEGGTANDQSLKIGSGSYIDGFEEGLIGTKPGQTVDLNLTFPENYGNDLAGADVVFTVTVDYIQTSSTTVPTLTDELVAALTKYTTVADYEAGIVKELSTTLTENYIWNNLMTNSKFKTLPQDAYKQYRETYINNYKTMAQSYNMDFSSFLQQSGMTETSFVKAANEYADGNVKSDLIIFSVMREQNITVTEEARTAALQKIYEEQYSTQVPDAKTMEEKMGKENADKLANHQIMLDTIAASLKIA